MRPPSESSKKEQVTSSSTSRRSPASSYAASRPPKAASAAGRSNKGGAVRGKSRAAQVHSMNRTASLARLKSSQKKQTRARNVKTRMNIRSNVGSTAVGRQSSGVGPIDFFGFPGNPGSLIVRDAEKIKRATSKR